MDCASPIIDVVSRLVDCSTKHLNYLRKLDENLNQLKEKMVQLNALNIDVKNKVNAEEARLMKRTNQVDEWMHRVEIKQIEVDRIILEGTQHLERRCLNGCCPKNCWSSYKFSKEVVNKIILVEELKRDGACFETFVENPPLAVTQELPEATPIVGMDSIFDITWSILGENSVRIMGLYGMGGVGKTTLLKRINNEFSKRVSDFDIVIWVVISKEVNMARVQEEIGKKLGLSQPDSNSIFNVLKTKKFMLLLDDIWHRIDLLSIGVPSPSLQNKSKIVFTTRSEVVCGRMEANKIIRVECLNWDAAWTLFQEKVGYTALSADSDIPRLAEIVAKECRGLPLALITIGRSMASKKTCHEWEHAISVLKNSAAEFPGMGDDVLPLLKFSYDSLPNDIVRLCFLFCSLYPEDYEIWIKVLIHQWIGEGYISGYDNFKEAFNNGHDIIGILKSACLLEADMEMNRGKVVKMHDVIRDLALWIGCECGRVKEKYFVKAGVGLIKAPRKWPTMAEKISLFDNEITQLESTPVCPNLSTLLISHNFILGEIHNDFFLSMPALKFLDLSNTGIRTLPTSICELVELEYLDLSRIKITSLPYQMRNLTKLKYLFLRTFNINRCMIPRGIISNLSNLEFLKLDVFKSEDYVGRFEIDELGCLKQLKYLEIRIYSDNEDVKKFLSYPQLVNCSWELSICCNDIISLSLLASSSSDLCLGDLKELQYLRIGYCSEIKELELNCINNETIELGGLYESLERMVLHNLPKLIMSWDAWTWNLHSGAHFRKLHYVYLEKCDAMVDLTWLLLIPNLQILNIHGCGRLQEILSSSSDESGGAFDQYTFSNLEFLMISHLPNLRSICTVSSLPFQSLESISVADCPNLRRLPLDSNSANNTLEKIEGEEEWWDSLEWENETIKLHFAKFYRIPS